MFIGTYYSEGLNAYVVQAYGDWKRDGWRKWSPVRAFKSQGDAILFADWLRDNIDYADAYVRSYRKDFVVTGMQRTRSASFPWRLHCVEYWKA